MPPYPRREKPVRGPSNLWPASPWSFDEDNGPQLTPIPIKIISDSPSPSFELPPVAPDLSGNTPDSVDKSKSDDFYPAWDRFVAKQTKRAKRVDRTVKALEKETEKVENDQPDGLHSQVNAVRSWEKAADECRRKVQAIVDECKRLNQKYRDAGFDLEANDDCLKGLDGSWPDGVQEDPPPWIKRVGDIFEKPEFFVDGASAGDVHQGKLGDCWFLSALMAITAHKGLMEKLCIAKNETVGVYGFVFYRDGEWVHEVIDDKLYINVGDDDILAITRDGNGQVVQYDEDKLRELVQRGGEALYFGHCKSNETWLPLIEKAYAKAHGDYVAIDGGWPSEGIEDLTGGVASMLRGEDIMDKDRFWYEQLRQVNKLYLFNISSGFQRWKKGVVPGHAYAILDTWEEGDLKLVKIKNPWGTYEWDGDWSDGSKLWTPEMLQKLGHTFGDDGIFWMSLKDMFKQFPALHRVRLFDDNNWQITQRWTCVSVPWTVDYMDTKFELTIAEKGPVVIVLAQPDDRYFKGLTGRFRYALHFRLYRAGETGRRYLVRSLHSSGGFATYTRSVSAELDDVEPGKYFVIFKVTPLRTSDLRPEEAIVQYAVDQKEKLLAVGRRYNMAQTKGNLRAMEKSERKARRDENFDKAIEGMRRLRKSNMKERLRDRKRQKRARDAINAQQKAIYERAVEKRKAERAKQQKESAENAAAQPSAAPAASSTTSEATQTVFTPSSSEGAATTKQEDIEAVHDPSTTLENKATAVDSAATEETEKPQEAGVDSKETASTVDTSATTPAKVEDQTTSTVSPIEAVNQAADEVAKLALGDGDAKPAQEEADTTAREASVPADPVPAAADIGSQPTQLPAQEDDPPYQDPADEPDMLENDDFEWDSDLDGPVNSDTSSRSSDAGKDIDIFADDPWSALCVLGLRVYAKCDVKIEVKTATEGAEDDVEVV